MAPIGNQQEFGFYCLAVLVVIIGVVGGKTIVDYISENNKTGLIVKKENKKFYVDVDGDKIPDNVLDMSTSIWTVAPFYEYAVVGDTISYTNRDLKYEVRPGFPGQKIKKINGMDVRRVIYELDRNRDLGIVRNIKGRQK